MTLKIQRVRGMQDILPLNSQMWQHFELAWQKLAYSYGYQEIRLPVIEQTSLFKRSIGDATDIVEKEMFCFQTKDDSESLALRPEGTASCVRACIEHGLLRHQVQRLWYMGPMFRHEAPQKGRYRQFHQVGVEVFGLEGPDVEVEHILMMARFWKQLGIEDAVQLQINTLGTHETRRQYREALTQYFAQHEHLLDGLNQKRLKTNPLRILDSKDGSLQALIQDAPKSIDYLDDDSKQHFKRFQDQLNQANIPFTINPNLVRGLDYYNRTVYEWVTDKLGSQGAICAGGRFDGLVEQLSNLSVPAVGFAIGIERVILLQEALGLEVKTSIDVYFIHVGEKANNKAYLIAEQLRDEVPNIKLMLHCGPGEFKQQFKKADKIGAKIALILGESELEEGTISVKFLRESSEQKTLNLENLSQFLNDYLGKPS